MKYYNKISFISFLIVLIICFNMVAINTNAEELNPVSVTLSQESLLTLTKITETGDMPSSLGAYFISVPKDTQSINVKFNSLSTDTHFLAPRGARKQITGNSVKSNARISSENFLKYNNVSSRQLRRYITNCFNVETLEYTISLSYTPGFPIDQEKLQEEYTDICFDPNLKYQEICIYEYKVPVKLKAVILVQIGESSTAKIDDSILKDCINKARLVSSETYYTSDDRYNGNDSSTINSSDKSKGFYNNLQLELANVSKLFIDNNPENDLIAGITQENVDTATTNLQSAINSLIPITNVNPTLLYEAIKNAENTYNDSSIYTAKSWSAYQNELNNAKTVLTSLYIQDGEDKGKPTNINKNTYQYEVDAHTERIIKAITGLKKLINANDPSGSDLIDAQEKYQNLKAIINQFNPEELIESDYTSDSFALFIQQRNIATDWLDNNEKPNGATGILVYEKLKEVYDDYWKSCYGLTSRKEKINVSLKVIDTSAARKKEVFDTKSGIYNLMLSSGASLEDVFNQINGINIYGDYGIFINGIMIDAPSHDLTALFTLNLGDSIGTSQYPLSSIKVQDKDEVVVAYLDTPRHGSSSGANLEGYEAYKVLPYVRLSKITNENMINNVVETRAGQAISFNASSVAANISDYTGKDEPFAGATVFVSPAVEEKNKITTANKETITVTDDNGNCNYTFYQEGWHSLSVHHKEANNLESKKVTVTGIIAGDTILVHVNPATENETKIIKDKMLTELEEAYYSYRQTNYDANKWKELSGFYENGNTKITNSVTPYEAKTAFDTAVNGMKSIESIDHKTFITPIREVLKYLPSIDEIDQNRLCQSDIPKLEELFSKYNALTEYQKKLFTFLEDRHIKSLLKAYADSNNGNNLPESKKYKLTIIDETNKFNQSNEHLYCMVDGNIISSARPTKIVGEVKANVKVGLRYKGRNIVGDTCVVESFSDDISFYKMHSPYKSILGEFLMPHHDVTIIVRSIGGDEPTIDDETKLNNAKDAARNAVIATYSNYHSEDYLEDDFTRLTQAKDSGITAINNAVDVVVVATARRAALAAMAAIPTKDDNCGTKLPDYGNVIGKVKITIENETFSSGDFKGMIINGWYDLCENDTMMTVVLKALAVNGYSWEGTGGTNYGITYISSINKGDKSMGEFSGDRGSGWMGTLNDWFVNEGFQSFRAGASNKDYSLENGDEIKVMFTQNLGEDLGGTWGNSDTSLKTLTISGGKLSPTFNKNITEYGLLIDGDSKNIMITPTAYNKNYLVKTFLNQYNSSSAYYKRTETVSVKNGDIIYIGIGENSWPSMNKQGEEAREYDATKYTIRVYNSKANYVNKLIEGLPAQNKIKLSNYKSYEEAVKAARSNYNKLSSNDKKKVTNLSRLIDAENQLLFYGEIDNVKILLKKIPLAGRVKLRHKSEVMAADSAYKKLSSEQKLYITVADVTNYNAAIERLKELGAFDSDNASPSVIMGNTEEPEEEKEEFIKLKPEVSISGNTATLTITDSQAKNAIEDIKKNQAEELIIEPVIKKDVDKVVVKLTKSIIDDLAKNTDAGLTAKSHVAEIKISNKALNSIIESSGSNVSIIVEQTDKEQLSNKNKELVGDKPIYNLYIKVDNKIITKFVGDVTVALPYIPKENEDINKLSVYYINDNNKVTKMTGAYYDDESESMIFKTDHFSTFAIVHDKDKITFKDVFTTDWYYDSVLYVVEQGLLDDISNNMFRPNENMTRGMFVNVIYKMAGDLQVTEDNLFKDIKIGSTYYDSVVWATYSKIVNGYSNDSFGTNDNITREQIATMMYRYAKLKGYKTTSISDISTYPDNNMISEWAVHSMKWAVSNKIISGSTENMLVPQGTATRGEVASMLKRFMENIVE
ncbi:S-layer homology domain-containing protein [Vallitalea guaymasensis]|uniref:S-layer homology domain-containing protein n=1 Tax=Vallitalea guaymasensis TaxID=1185412 RepID=UPI0023571030|nr:S-layer homology domain-containing protein [Vallitalea guaymasensis]